MRYLSLFSGIEAATVAWHPLGWECVGVSEIEPFPCNALANHYPNVPNLGDVTKITEADIFALGPIDLVVFGSPCQDLSVAGKRKGFTNDDGQLTRSGLFHTAMRIVGWAREHCGCRFALWENVPGAFSSNEGRDFATVVDLLAGLEGTDVPPKGWGTEGCALGEEAMVEWSTLDAQWFGVAQRRRRVFALADFGDWTRRPPILLESEGVRGDSAPRRETGQNVAPTISARTKGGGGLGTDFDLDGGLVPERVLLSSTGDVAHCLNAGGMGRIDYETETMLAVAVTGDIAHALNTANNGKGCSEDGTGRGVPTIAYRTNAAGQVMDQGGCAAALTTMTDPTSQFIVFDTTQITSPENRSKCEPGSPCHSLSSQGHAPSIAIQAGALRENPDSGPDGIGVQEDIAYTLEARSEVQAVAFQSSQSGVRIDDVHATLDSNNGPRRHNGVLQGWQVRRLTPLECERLQAFPDRYTNVATKVKRLAPVGSGPCVKQTVTATVVSTTGAHYVATNHCLAPQSSCPRAGMPTGVGYELCRDVCNQPAHAEVNAITFAGKHAKGATLYLEGHTYACESCKEAAEKAGVVNIVFEPAPGNAADGPRYKALGNSMCVNVMNWIGRSIEAATWDVWV